MKQARYSGLHLATRASMSSSRLMPSWWDWQVMFIGRVVYVQGMAQCCACITTLVLTIILWSHCHGHRGLKTRTQTQGVEGTRPRDANCTGPAGLVFESTMLRTSHLPVQTWTHTGELYGYEHNLCKMHVFFFPEKIWIVKLLQKSRKSEKENQQENIEKKSEISCKNSSALEFLLRLLCQVGSFNLSKKLWFPHHTNYDTSVEKWGRLPASFTELV